MLWYKQNTEQLYENLETSEMGLSKSEVNIRLKKYGQNQLAVKKEPLWKVIIAPFKDIFVIVLTVAAIVSLLSGEPLDAAIIGVIIMVNAGIYYSQQYATTKVLRNLNKRRVQQVTVVRNGEQLSTPSFNLVPGDIFYVKEGERISADARIIHTDNLQINEALLTGESVPVRKNASTLDSLKQIYEQDNMIFQGTYAISGTARALVVETGGRTEFGKIANLAVDDNSKSPVQAKIDKLISLLVKVAGVLAIIVFVLSLARGIPTGEVLRLVLSMTVSAVPEGLPVALTVIIVLGMRRMAKKKALVRSFRAIEDIGLITTIATDKTGTLTKDHLTVVDSWSSGDEDVVKFADRMIDTSVSLTNPLDLAVKEYTGNHRGHKIDEIYPFDAGLRMSGSFFKDINTIYIEGAPEHILAKSTLVAKQLHAAESVMHGFTSKGYRVIAFGKYLVKSEVPKDLSAIDKNDIEFIGFLAFADELRPEAKGAIRAAQAAGISVRLITGDHYETAYNIGKQLNLATHPDQVIQGFELPKNMAALAEMIKTKTIFARILPEDKFRILQALKQTEITAMTGDGVNDVPALANAHVGIAMGSGSDIAKDAGGIILLDNNFATIIKAIAEGRKIFYNIRRMLFYLLSTSLGEALTMVGALLFGLPLPVTAIQILWINLVTDTAMVLPLGLEPEEDGHMARPPRRPKDPLMSRILLTRTAIIGLTMAIVTLFAVSILAAQGYETAQIQTIAFLMLIVAQWMNAFNARSEFKSSFSRIKKMNYGLIVGLTIASILQALVMFGPLRGVFGVQAVPAPTLLITSGIMVIAILVVSELHKFIVRNTSNKTVY
ncbi:MAG: cation-transporting P-type ATPase [Actinomycetota bacterium]